MTPRMATQLFGHPLDLLTGRSGEPCENCGQVRRLYRPVDMQVRVALGWGPGRGYCKPCIAGRMARRMAEGTFAARPL